MEYLKKNLKNIGLVFIYTLVAVFVYATWVHSLWNTLWIDIVTIVGIILIGAVFGYFYIRQLNKKEKKEEVTIEVTKKENE